jgi:hypothetical protein
MLHWDDPNPDGSNNHTCITEEEALKRYKPYYYRYALEHHKPLLTDEQIIEDILIINWGWRT